MTRSGEAIVRDGQARIDWDDLSLLRAIGDAGALSSAAQRLGVDHSTAFRRLGALEARLGVRLFDRARGGYAPTSAGEIALAAAGGLLDGLADLERRLVGTDLRPSGLVRVTTTDTLVDLLAPMLAEFRLAYPAIQLELPVANAFFTLARRDADVAVRPALEPPEGLAGRRIGAIATALYAGRAYLDTRPADLPLPEHDWVGPDDSLEHLGSAQWIRRAIPPERVAVRASSLLALRAAARAGLGVAPLPCYLAEGDSALVRLGDPLPEMASALWLLTHPDLQRTARVRAILDFLAARLAKLRPILDGSA